MEKYKYCNMGRARELSSGGREGGREESRKAEDGSFDCTEGEKGGDARKEELSLAGYRDAAFG